MADGGRITGTGAVNERDEAVVFVGGRWTDFDRFKVDGSEISLGSASGWIHSRTYGPLCVAAARESGRILVIEVGPDGKPGRAALTEAVRGTGSAPHGR